jgi:Methyltransferase FkbM domain
MQQISKSNLAMLMRLYHGLIRILAVAKAFPSVMTDPRVLHTFIKKLHPLSTDKSLIRLGPTGDGGYVLPNDLVGISACFSPGVSSVSGFEKDCANLGMQVFLADKSVEQPADKHELFHFTKKFVGVTSNEDFMTLDHWVMSSLPNQDSDLLLQIDIEGYEYEVFLSMSDSLMQRFRIIVVEFHSLDQLWSKPFFKVASRAFDKILQTHTCVHIHPNNVAGMLRKNGIDIPKVMEFTFLRNDRIRHSHYQTVFPNPLDYDNTGRLPLSLPQSWYHQ